MSTDLETVFLAALKIKSAEGRAAYLAQVCGEDAELRQRVERLLEAHESMAAEFLQVPEQGELFASNEVRQDRSGEITSGGESGLGEGSKLISGAASNAGGRPRREPESASTADQAAAELPPGTLIAGRYKLLEPIGEGGMGTVYMAQQIEPVKRLVALKLIKPGMDSRQVLARFSAERQALALMDHPNIARVLDGGTIDWGTTVLPDGGTHLHRSDQTDEATSSGDSAKPGQRHGLLPPASRLQPVPAGRPYFVMELVRGIPLTEYCDQRRLSIQERLELFIQVCSAVQHAHQKGIIHRDLKPSNILVTEHDTRPVPIVIDFGLAKALGGSGLLSEQTLHTAYGTVVGTPLYMAPEQVGISALDVDTRSDIYSLGVLLYELLTGTTPIEKRRYKKAAWEEVQRIIREEDAPAPSLRLSSSDTLPSVAASRHIEPAKLTRLVRGELDWIVLKALEKDRNRRYATANGLARDIQRYLADEPVEARPASRGYRLWKSYRKNMTAVIAAALVLLSLVGGIVIATHGMVMAQRAKHAEAIHRQLAETRRADADEARPLADQTARSERQAQLKVR